MTEQSIASARASVMIYDEANKKWVPSGSSSGVSKVHIYYHVINNSYRVVGRKLHDQEVVINCSILKGLKYNQATPTFHQWRDNRQVYGLSFSSKDDAEAFAYSMMHAVEALKNASNGGTLGRINNNVNVSTGMPAMPMQAQPPQQPPLPVMNHQMLPQPITNHPHEEDKGYQTMTPEDIAYISIERRMSQPQQQPVAMPSLSSPNTPVVVSNGAPPGHHRTNSAPQPPLPPPPAMGGSPGPAVNGNRNGPPPMNMGGGGPPPPPPPMPNGPLSKSGDGDAGSLANALANAHLRKTNRVQQADAASISSSSSSGSTSSGSIYGTLRCGRTNGAVADPPAGGGGVSLMDEMQKTLARRRAMVKETSAPDVPSLQNNSHNSQDAEESKPGSDKKKDSSSPKMNQIERSGSVTSTGIVNGSSTGYDSSLEALKQDILKEMRIEMNKMKAEIIDAIKIELNRR